MQTKWQFEEFEAGPVIQDAQRIHATLSPKGYFYINGRAIKALGEPDGVVLFYDRRMQTIAMKGSSLTKRNTYRLKMKDGEKCGGRMLYASNFCKHYNIRPSTTIAFTRAKIEDDLLILSLHEVAQVEKR